MKHHVECVRERERRIKSNHQMKARIMQTLRRSIEHSWEWAEIFAGEWKTQTNTHTHTNTELEGEREKHLHACERRRKKITVISLCMQSKLVCFRSENMLQWVPVRWWKWEVKWCVVNVKLTWKAKWAKYIAKRGRASESKVKERKAKQQHTYFTRHTYFKLALGIWDDNWEERTSVSSERREIARYSTLLMVMMYKMWWEQRDQRWEERRHDKYERI